MNTTDPLAILFGMPDVVRAATVYRARVGRRRAFMSLADAYAYERGFDAYPEGPMPTAGTPASTGYFDHEAEVLDRLDDDRRGGSPA